MLKDLQLERDLSFADPYTNNLAALSRLKQNSLVNNG